MAKQKLPAVPVISGWKVLGWQVMWKIVAEDPEEPPSVNYTDFDGLHVIALEEQFGHLHPFFLHSAKEVMKWTS